MVAALKRGGNINDYNMHDENMYEVPFTYVLDDVIKTSEKSGGYYAQKITAATRLGGVYGTKSGSISTITYDSFGKSSGSPIQTLPDDDSNDKNSTVTMEESAKGKSLALETSEVKGVKLQHT
ncbi:hypothetical protein E2562_031666 [Oryza meyeriana var. granulata]|uniref:Uncharacterized protein n=1 Tax=Oryza meyeriana var. granulata TaxID=110450 RepID=A0A6G1E3Y6_9ORYZ|nr:hypothetical protein E2562_031666 [Oryza meyeriana var. granulata]